ncbi:hypothetical protein SO694_00010115 [Aureococcus anophagefferens]|uniref:Uncharacterized protein n=2 Tax=Aureococcus anophagefferens TaxID=44056 RepID=F0YGY3_AURAN|nr:hypothetical protein AURANDRAFT_66324 [Aureococcus anophagefferens]EGB05567.1 hypothetical protein AURANDRAFT_66324 [Aureococcus anophagefferens]KAH8067283.1 hypothetical protein JL721_7692 [Aureococcus anophagefferens]|eukprot:XP_009039698.1 hypothetical protein AURANDRAFT_66324 [Aureococcus anophagefferens]
MGNNLCTGVADAPVKFCDHMCADAIPEPVDDATAAASNGVTGADVKFFEQLLSDVGSVFTTVTPTDHQQEMTKCEFGVRLVQSTTRARFPEFHRDKPRPGRMTIKTNADCKCLVVVERKEDYATTVVALAKHPADEAEYQMVFKKQSVGKTFLAIFAQYDDGIYCTNTSYFQGSQARFL